MANNKKSKNTKRIFAIIIAVLLVGAMVLPLVLSAIR